MVGVVLMITIIQWRSMEGYSIRFANRRDVSEILRLIQLVADREKSEVEVTDRGSTFAL